MKKSLLIVALLLHLSGFSKIIVITNWGVNFSPADTTVTIGDTIKFSLGNTHNVLEVSQEDWDAEQNIALSGGFSLPLGGGILPTAQLTPGTHYYICTPHITIGMKGKFTLVGASGINDLLNQPTLSLYPNPASEFLSIQSSDNVTGLSYSILDETGKQVATGKLTGYKSSLDIHYLANGMYLFQLASQRRKTVSFIKN
jgi:plastocyanin